MVLRIISSGSVESNITKAQKEYENSLEKLSSGVRFTRSEPMPAERARSDKLMAKMRELNVYKQNANQGLSFTETLDSSLNSVSNSIIRLKELVAQSTNPALSDKERGFLFVEYQAHYESLVSSSPASAQTEGDFIRSEGSSGEAIHVRVSSPNLMDGKDIGLIPIENLDKIKLHPEDLGIKSAEALVNAEEGVSLDDVLDNFDVSEVTELGASFDQAHLQVSEHRANIGAATARLNSALNTINIAYENTAAANSRIRDVDYATEMTNLARANILVQASSSLLAQKNQHSAESILTLVKSTDQKNQ